MRCLLRINNSYFRQILFVTQKLFVLPMPIKNIPHHWHPSLIHWLGIELCEPGTQPMGNAIVSPQSNFSIGLHRIFPAVRFFHPHAEDAANGLASHGGTIFFAVLAIAPGRHGSTTRLLIGEQCLGKLSHCFHIQFRQRSTTRIGNECCVWIHGTNGLIPQSPQFE